MLLKNMRSVPRLLASILAAVYLALIESHLRYGDIIWGCILDTKLILCRNDSLGPNTRMDGSVTVACQKIDKI